MRNSLIQKIFIILLICVGTMFSQTVIRTEPGTSGVRVVEPQNYLKKILKNEKDYLKNLSASMKANLEIIKEIDEKRYLELLNEARFSTASWSSFAYGGRVEKDENIIELEIETQALAMQYKSNKGNKDQIKQNLQVSLELLLDFKEERRQRELKNLELKIKELRKSIEERKKNKKEIIRRRMMDMLGESQYYKWD